VVALVVVVVTVVVDVVVAGGTVEVHATTDVTGLS